MERRRSSVGVLLVVLLLSAFPSAHHSFGAEYDANNPITLTGVLTNIEWTNPHSHFYLDVKDNHGQGGQLEVRRLSSGGAVPDRLEERRDHEAGDTITVFGWRARDGGNWAHSREITVPDGRKMFFGPPAGTGDGGNTPAVEVK